MANYTNVITNPRGRGLTGWTGSGVYNSEADGVEIASGNTVQVNTPISGRVTILVHVESSDDSPVNIAVGYTLDDPSASSEFTVPSGRTVRTTVILDPGTSVSVAFSGALFPGPGTFPGINVFPGVGASSIVVRLAVVAGDGPKSYFDGDTADTPQARYSWAGTPHASTSLASVIPVRGPCGLWFGTNERREWLAAPDEGVTINSAGWGAQGTYLSGGAYVRRTSNRHKTYTMSWSEISGDDLAVLSDFYDGLYGDGPFYFVLPGTTSNILPQAWATPRLAVTDAPPLVESVRPAPLASPSNQYGHPTASALYTVIGTDSRRQVLPIYVPEDMVLHLGVRGSFSAGIGMEYKVDGAANTLPSVVGDELTNRTVLGPAKVELSLQGEGTASINSMTAALTNSFTPLSGKFVSGKGHSGAQFPENGLTTTLVSAKRDAWGAAASFTETGQWR